MVPCWHAITYLTLFFGSFVEVSIHGSNDATNRPQFIADIWDDFPVLYKLQHGTFPLSILAIEKDKIGHRITKIHWDNSLLF